jgi:hypothetical protein
MLLIYRNLISSSLLPFLLLGLWNMQKEKELSGWDLNNYSLSTALSFRWEANQSKKNVAEAVGSTPTRSISSCYGNTVLF